MLTISKPLSAGQAQTYHQEEFANAQENYYSEGDRIGGEWHSKLAQEWGLRGEVNEEHFHRLANGQHPITGEQLVRHQTAREYLNERTAEDAPKRQETFGKIQEGKAMELESPTVGFHLTNGGSQIVAA